MVVAPGGANGAGGDPLVGATLGHCTLQRRLAEGGMGVVYAATNWKLGRPRVVKVMHAHVASQPHFRERFLREAQAVAALRHRNIIDIFDHGETPDGQLYLEIEYLDGQTLTAALAASGGKLGEYRVFQIVLQLCSALAHAHERGIVHRDLKPDNVFVMADHSVKLLDFGIAKMREQAPTGATPATAVGSTMGTPGYMAVEQFGSAAKATHLADVFALSVITWELLTGRLPWGQHDLGELIFKQQAERPIQPPPSEMSAEYFEILSTGLAPDPQYRPQSMRALALALASATVVPNRLVPSVKDLLERYAPEFIPSSLDELTVRHRPDHEAPIQAPAARITTLGAASGAVAAPTRARAAGKRTLVVGGAVVVTAIVAFAAIASRGRAPDHESSTPAALPSAAPSDAPTTQPDANAIQPSAVLADAPLVTLDAASPMTIDAPRAPHVPASTPHGARPTGATSGSAKRPPDNAPFDPDSPTGK